MSFKKTEVGSIPFEWKVDIIDNIKSREKNSIAMGPFGSNIKKENFVDNGIPVIRGNNLNSIKLQEEEFVFLTDQKAEKLKASEVKKGDIVITHRGTLGQVSIVPFNSKYNKYIVSQSGMKLTCDNEKVNPFFITYFLHSRIGQYLLLRNKSQVGVPSIATPTTSLKKIPVPLPKIDEQNSIVKVLSDLDEKIEINNKINENLEKIAQAIFKQWFVDFEFPNENGEPYKSSGGEMRESELGEIPKGWEVNKLSELADMKNGVNYGRDQEGEEIKVVNVRDFDGSLLVNYEKLDSISLSKKQIEDYKLEKYDTVIVRSAKPGETLLVNDSKLKVYSGFTIRIRVKNYAKKLYTFYCVRNSIKELENSSNGTIFKNLNQQLLGALNIIEPCEKVLEKYNRIIYSIIEKIYSINEENNKLIKLRDTLLPKLMAGEIRVPLD